MEILDIVHRAIQRSQVIPGFNPSECPEDYEERVSDILVNELIPNMNCDRGLDLTEIVLTYTPREGVIDLVAPPADEQHFIVTLPYSSRYLLTPTEESMYSRTYGNLIDALDSIGISEDSMPKDPTGDLIPIGIWTTDLKFIECPKLPIESWGSHQEGSDPTINPVYNVPFTPMMVTGIVDPATGAEIEYKHAMEFISAEYRHARFVFMDEVYEDKLRIRFHMEWADNPVQIVIPVPLTVVNYFDSPKPWSGKIIAPRKFRDFLISELAFRIADEYGIANAPNLEKASSKAYNMLLKNYPKRQHGMDMNKRIAETLRRPVGMVVTTTGSYGGYNG